MSNLPNLHKSPYKGVFPVVPTTFNTSGELDFNSQKRCIDFMIDAGANGLTILANFSEQFLLSDSERDFLTEHILKYVDGRVPVIVTTSHFSTQICLERSTRAESMGASMVMVLPPYHGATIRVNESLIFEFYEKLSSGLSIPIMIQDAPISGTNLSVEFLARMALEIENVSYFKIESASAATKLRNLIRLGGTCVKGPWDGEEGITLLADLEAGATGAMTGGAYPDAIREITDPYFQGAVDVAAEAYSKWLPLINYENRQGGILTAKTLLKVGGIIDCDLGRHPYPSMTREVRDGLISLAKKLNPMVMNWAK